MKTFQLTQGLTISTAGEVFEYTNCTLDELYFQSPHTGQRLIFQRPDFYTDYERGLISILDTISTPKALLIADQPDEHIPLISDLKEKYLEDLERKLAYIDFLRSEGITRGQRKLISVALQKFPQDNQNLKLPSASTVQAWWKSYDSSLDGNQALISGNAYRQRSGKLDDDSEFFLQEEIQDNYAQITRPSAQTAYGKYRQNLVSMNNLRIQNGRSVLIGVCARTFSYRIKKLPQYELTLAREGAEAARKKYHISKGPLPAKFPLDVVEIDHTLMNLYVVDDLTFLPLGRPTITAIKDKNSGILLGMYMSFSGGGLASIAGSIKHSLTAHRLAFDLWDDLENPWPAYGLGTIYLSDRGPDYKSPRYRSMIKDLKANHKYCEVRIPWLKGSIERFFLTLEQTFFETLPGKTFNSLAERQLYDPQKQAVIRFSTLVYLLHKWAVDFHNVNPHSRTMATPLEIWQEGIGIAPPPVPVSPQQLNIILGSRQQGTIRNEGVQYKGLHYSDPTLQAMVDRFGKGIKVDFIVTPDNLGHIHVKDPRTQEYLRINSTRPDYTHGLTLFQHQYIRKQVSEYSKRNHSYEALFEARRNIENRVHEDIFSRDNSRKKQLARVAGINSNDVLEGKPRSVQKPFEYASPAHVIQNRNKHLPQESPMTSIPAYDWGA